MVEVKERSEIDIVLAQIGKRKTGLTENAIRHIS